MKIFNKKRVASVALAGALALSMAAPAFAADPYSLTIEGTVQDVTLNVTVPTTGDLIINPYGLPHKLGETYIKGEQIVNPKPLTIVNRSEVALDARVAVSAEVTGGDMEYVLDYQTTTAQAVETAKTAVKAGTYNKAVIITYEAFKSDLTADTLNDTSALNSRYAALKSANAHLTVTPTTDRNSSNKKSYVADSGEYFADPLAGTGGVVTGSKLILREASAEGTVQKGGVAFMRISGVAAEEPTTAWTTSDAFKVTIAWTFVPATYENAGGSIGFTNATVTAAGTNAATLTIAGLPDGVTAKKIIWTSSDTSYATVTGDSSSTTSTANATVTVLNKSTGGQAKTITITAVITGSDGYPYTARGTFDVNI